MIPGVGFKDLVLIKSDLVLIKSICEVQVKHIFLFTP